MLAILVNTSVTLLRMVYVHMNKQKKDVESIENKFKYIENHIGAVDLKFQKLDYSLKRTTRYLFSILLTFVIIAFATILLFSPNSDASTMEGGHFITKSLIGDSVDTWLSWQLPDSERVFHIHIINQANISQKNIDIIKESILSEKIVEINDLDSHKGPSTNSSKFYAGWQGALNEFNSLNLQYNIPISLHVHESSSHNGDIIILLIDEKNVEGYSGYTRSIIDEEKNQILKSHITIYESSKLDGHKLASITRHEIGHALGLQHSTDPDDIMYHKIKTENQYISECDVGALKSLYNGNIKSEFSCYK